VFALKHGRNVGVDSDEGQVTSLISVVLSSALVSPRVAGRHSRPQLRDLRLQEVDRHEERLDRLLRVAPASRDRVVGGGFQVGGG
jgi:hypothetical protein